MNSRRNPRRTSTRDDELVTTVRERYGRIASAGASCCGSAGGCAASTTLAAQLGYASGDLALLPDGTDLGLGEVVLDLGSGAGIDALIAARAVGPSGRVIGVDMTDEMLDRARSNASRAGVDHVEFRCGRLEELPVDADTIDAATSNCVINLVPDKAAVFREVTRVLKRGGRLVVSDIILDGDLPEAIANDVTAWVGCVAGAMRRDRYFALLPAAGLADVEILKDVDYVALASGGLPPDLRRIVEAAAIDLHALEGVVRSVTYRAWKR